MHTHTTVTKGNLNQPRKTFPWYTLIVPNVLMALGLWMWNWNIAHVAWQLFLESYISAIALGLLSQANYLKTNNHAEYNWAEAIPTEENNEDDDVIDLDEQARIESLQMLAFVSVFYLCTALCIWIIFHVEKTPENSDFYFVDAQPMPSLGWFVGIIVFFGLSKALTFAVDQYLGYRLTDRIDTQKIPGQMFGSLWWYWMMMVGGFLAIGYTQEALALGAVIISVRMLMTVLYWLIK